MSAQHLAPDARTDNEHHSKRPSGELSTRVLLEAGSPPTCDACGGTIELKSRHKCLTVSDGTERVERTYCDEDCLARREAVGLRSRDEA